MNAHESTVSLADLSAAGVVVRYPEAVTIVRELALRVSRGELPGVPSPHVIRLAPSGGISVEGPVAAGHRGVERAAYLLETLLPGFEAPQELRVPGALRLVVARALGTLDLPRYETLELFAEALSRFAAPDAATSVRGLVTRRALLIRAALQRSDRCLHARRRGDDEHDSELFAGVMGRPVRIQPWPVAELTISDIRRARRATGLTLTEISHRSQISSRLLRELEWGYFRNWPASHFGRRQLVRYARAAGLDDRLVVSTVWPLLEESASIPPLPAALMEEEEVLSPVTKTTALVTIPNTGRNRTGRSTRWTKMGAAAAIPAILVFAVTVRMWNPGGNSSAVPRVAPAVQSSQPARTVAPAPPRESEPTPRSPALPPPVTAAARSHVAPALRPGASAPPRPVAGIPDGRSFSPAFDTVGTAMFYHADSNSGTALMRADTDSRGSILRITSVVDDHARNFHARPSPDGSRIAFDSDRDGERAVFIADADGHNVQRISGDGFAAIPSWSPDGTALAFVRAEAAHPKVWNLWTADVSGGPARRLTSFRVGQPWGASWFPDGRRIAFSHEDRLIVMDLATRAQRVYPSPIHGRLVRTPAVSPDGSRVVFQVSRDGAWLLELEDGSMRKVLSDPSAEEYTWSPDGRRIAYHSRRSDSWGVWVMASR